MSSSEMEIAHQTQEKFEFYLLSLVFTLLALSVQTAKFGVFLPSTIFELFGWFFLLISGLIGLWRMEYLSIERVKLAKLDEFNEAIYEVKRLILSGTNEIYVASTGRKQPLDERIKNLEEGVKLLTPVTEKLEKRNLFKYKIHKFSFILGVICLVVARSIEPFTMVVKELIKST